MKSDSVVGKEAAPLPPTPEELAQRQASADRIKEAVASDSRSQNNVKPSTDSLNSSSESQPKSTVQQLAENLGQQLKTQFENSFDKPGSAANNVLEMKNGADFYNNKTPGNSATGEDYAKFGNQLGKAIETANAVPDNLRNGVNLVYKNPAGTDPSANLVSYKDPGNGQTYYSTPEYLQSLQKGTPDFNQVWLKNADGSASPVTAASYAQTPKVAAPPLSHFTINLTGKGPIATFGP